MDYIINNSLAGKSIIEKLNKKRLKNIEKFKKDEEKLKSEEKKIISQKKVVSAEEYKKKVTDLRLKVSNLQKDRNKLLESVANQRAKARAELLKNLNPIIKDSMSEKNIRMVIDKKSMLLADEKLDITKDILKILNTKLKSIKLN